MLETGRQMKGRSGATVPLLIAGGLAAGIAAVGYLEWSRSSTRPPEEIVLHNEARAYLHSLDLDGVEMSAKENALGQTLVEITGRIKNLGGRQVSRIRLNCVFFDVYGVELHRVLTTIVRSRDGLAPAAERDFRLAFDDIPEGWNQTLPSLYIAEILFD